MTNKLPIFRLTETPGHEKQVIHVADYLRRPAAAKKNNFPLAPTINLPPWLTLSLAEDDNKDLSVFVPPPVPRVTLFDTEPSRRGPGHAQSREARERVTKCLSRERDKKKGL